MDKAARPGAERRTMGTSDTVLWSMTNGTAQQFASTANPLVPTANLMSLATETIFFITGHLDEGDLWALTLVNHRFNSIATPLLWKSLSDNPERQKEVLLWAVEAGQHALLQNLLEKAVSPNFLYLSSILRSRLKDLLAARGLRGAVSPREDRAFEAEVFREKYCRSAIIRNYVRRQRGSAGLDLAMTDNDLEWNLTHADYQHTCSLRVFGIDRILGGTEDRQYWAWAPIHVAVLRGDNTALRMLLDHGADVNAQCSGLCDCAVPDLTGYSERNISVAPHRDRSVWTPLHVAMCTGNLDAARLLIARGASALVGSLIRQSYGVDRKCRLSMNAFQNVAWIGSVPMCRILMGTPRFRQFLDRCNLKLQTALHYAAAGGNIRTVGKLLLENGATFHFYEGDTPRLGGPRIRNDPLRLLCMHGKYDDARWLVYFCLDLYQGRALDPRPLYTRALAAVCDLRQPTAYNRLSLRAQQDQLYSLTAQDIDEFYQVDWQEVERSGLHRVTLAITLLSFGADANGTQEVPNPHQRSWYRTPLQIAASSQFHQMVGVLLSHGADYNKIGFNPIGIKQQDLADLPLMLAITRALFGRPKGNLAATQLLIKGTSLADIGEQSVLARLQALLWNGEGGYCNFMTQDAVWLSIAQMLLRHGAAAATSQKNWEAIVAFACVPTNLEYCKLLEKWRPIRGFSERTLTEMLRGALFGCGDWVEQKTPEDLELVKWVLGHCLNSEGRMLLSKDALLNHAEAALSAGRVLTANAVEECVWDTPDPDDQSGTQGTATSQDSADRQVSADSQSSAGRPDAVGSQGPADHQGTAGAQSASKM